MACRWPCEAESSGVHGGVCSGLAGPHSCTAGFLGSDSELYFNFLENTHCCITSNAFSQTAAVTAEHSQGLSRRALPIFIKVPPFQEPSLLSGFGVAGPCYPQTSQNRAAGGKETSVDLMRSVHWLARPRD